MIESGHFKVRGMIAVKHNTVFFCAVAVLTPAISFGGQTNDWENLAVNSRNREPARTYSMPLASEAAAFTDALEPASPYKVSLGYLNSKIAKIKII